MPEDIPRTDYIKDPVKKKKLRKDKDQQLVTVLPYFKKDIR